MSVFHFIGMQIHDFSFKKELWHINNYLLLLIYIFAIHHSNFKTLVIRDWISKFFHRKAFRKKNLIHGQNV